LQTPGRPVYVFFTEIPKNAGRIGSHVEIRGRQPPRMTGGRGPPDRYSVANQRRRCAACAVLAQRSPAREEPAHVTRRQPGRWWTTRRRFPPPRRRRSKRTSSAPLPACGTAATSNPPMGRTAEKRGSIPWGSGGPQVETARRASAGCCAWGRQAPAAGRSRRRTRAWAPVSERAQAKGATAATAVLRPARSARAAAVP